jgi:RNA polymerase sigma-70 factor (ECF subfamily)
MQNNRKEKFEELCRPVISDLHKHIKFIIKDSTLTDDAYQNSLLIAYEKLDSLRDETKFKAWIYKIATNESYRLLKKNKNEISVDDYFNTEESICKTAELQIILKEEKIDVMKALQKLSYNQKRLMVMMYYWNLGYKEISSVLKLSVNTLRVQNHRALGRLREILKGEINEKESKKET